MEKASADLMEGVRDLEKARAAYEEAEQYASGHLAERFASDRIRHLVENSGRRYRFRLSSVPVTAMANRTRIAAITGPSQEITTRIEEIRTANDLVLQEPHIHLKTLTYGDGYVMVWPVDPEEFQDQEDGERTDVAPDDALTQAGVDITYQSPLACRIVYDDRAGRRPRFAIRRWREETPLGIKYWYAELWYVDRLELWRTGPDEDGTQEEHWHPYAEDVSGLQVPAVEGENWPEPHDWGEIPIKHARTDLPYGRPEHVEAYGGQDMITKAVVTQGMELEAHGWPDRAQLLDDQALLESNQEHVDWDDDSTQARASRERGTGLVPTSQRRGPGTITKYPGTRDVIQFPAPQPGELNDPLDLWIRMLSTATQVPFWEFDPVGGAQLSGVAREKADAPMKSKEENRKAFLLSFWREVWALALKMDGKSVRADQIDILWKPPPVVSDPEWWATAEVRMRAGVPQRQILLEANYLPEDVDKWIKDQEEGMALSAKVDLLERIGAAIQAIGAGVAVGMLEQGQAAKIVEGILDVKVNHQEPKPEPAPALPTGDPRMSGQGQPPAQREPARAR